VDEVWGIEFQEILGFLFIDLEPALNDFEIGVIETVLLESPSLHPVDQLSIVRAGEMEEDKNIEGFLEDPGLASVPGYAIEDEEMVEGIEEVGLGFGLDVFTPESDGELVRHEPALAGVLEESAAEFGFGLEPAEDFATGAVVVTGNGAEDLALGALAGAWGTEQQDGAVPHRLSNHALASL
jgi:hypothetical protein